MNLPIKFTNRMKKLLGEDYENYLDSFSQERLYGLRVNTLKITPEEFELKSDLNITKIPFIDNGFYYRPEDSPSKHPFYHAGLYYIQEPSAMIPASMLPVNEGDKVLDLCAAPGGKSTELGAKLKSTGILVSNDISNSRAKALLKNIELFGIKNGVVVSEDPKKLVNYFEGYFDKILVDAPCSGEGMFRKDPSIIKNWEQYGVEYYNKIQKEIILLAASMLKPGGQMLYSTCTFSPEENEGVISYLLHNRPDFSVEKLPLYDGFDTGKPEWLQYVDLDYNVDERMERALRNCIRLWPHRIKGEGHFVALLKKADSLESKKCVPYKVKKNKDISDLKSFLQDINYNFPDNNIEVFEEKTYFMPEGLPNLKGLRILRSGFYLGDIKKNRFEPSQSLAMGLGAYQYKNIVNFEIDDPNVIKYLKCETITLPEEVSSGMKLVCVDGFPLGWAKASGNMLKNKYHSGWRLM